METINSIPTDNLYKFLAISGLFVVLFSVYYPNEVIYDSIERKMKILERHAELNYNVEANSKRLSQLYDELKSLTVDFNETVELKKDFISKSNSLTKAEYNNYIARIDQLDLKINSQQDHIKKEENEIEAIRKQLDLESFKIKNEIELTSILDAKISLYRSLLTTGSIIGVLIMIYGFAKWFKLQKAMDKKLLKK